MSTLHWNNDAKINSVTEYRTKYITEWDNGIITVSLMRYESIEAAMKAIDKLLLLTKNVIG